MTLTQLPASTPPPLAPYFRNVFLEGSELFHITQLVIKSHNKLFPSFLHNFQAAPPMSRSSLFALFVTAVLSFPCVCTHIGYNEKQEREPWHHGLTLLSLHHIAYRGFIPVLVLPITLDRTSPR